MTHRVKKWLILFLILVVIVAVLAFRRAPSEKEGTPQTSPEQALSQRLTALKNIQFDLSLLDEETFQLFEQSGDLPLDIPSKGRLNPFEP